MSIPESYNLAPTQRASVILNRVTGLWEDTSPLLDADNLGTFTVITGDSSGVSADIHDRMPAWPTAGQADEWMAAETDDAMAMLLASEPPAMDAYRVSRAVNTPRNNGPRLLQPA